jgi:DNA-binding CsgD family transcriptional regulator
MTWLDRASATAIESPTPLRARRLESWRGHVHLRAGNAEEMLRHLERAAELAAEREHPAARCEAQAQLALAAARLGAERDDEELLVAAERAGRAATELCSGLPGHPPWGAQGEAALAQVALCRGDLGEALQRAQNAIAALQEARQEDLHLDVLTPVAKVLRATEAPEWAPTAEWIQLSLAMIAQRTMDEDVRVKWFRGPVGSELFELAGPLSWTPEANGDGSTAELDGSDAELLRCLIQGRTNAQIAEELGLDETTVSRRLGELFTRIGTSSRAGATAFAFRERVV